MNAPHPIGAPVPTPAAASPLSGGGRETIDTYVITDPDEVYFHGPCVGTVTNALTGVTEAVFRSGHRLPLDTPLCSGCDTPVENDRCPECEGVAAFEQHMKQFRRRHGLRSGR